MTSTPSHYRRPPWLPILTLPLISAYLNISVRNPSFHNTWTILAWLAYFVLACRLKSYPLSLMLLGMMLFAVLPAESDRRGPDPYCHALLGGLCGFLLGLGINGFSSTWLKVTERRAGSDSVTSFPR